MTSPDQPLPEGVDLREQVARKIDPLAWAIVYTQREYEAEHGVKQPQSAWRTAESLAKADAILALFQSNERTEPSVGWRVDDITRRLRRFVNGEPFSRIYDRNGYNPELRSDIRALLASADAGAQP